MDIPCTVQTLHVKKKSDSSLITTPGMHKFPSLSHSLLLRASICKYQPQLLLCLATISRQFVALLNLASFMIPPNTVLQECLLLLSDLHNLCRACSHLSAAIYEVSFQAGLGTSPHLFALVRPDSSPACWNSNSKPLASHLMTVTLQMLFLPRRILSLPDPA